MAFYEAPYVNRLSAANRSGRILWRIVHAVAFRPSPAPLFAWRVFLLRCFGAKVDWQARPYPSVQIWAPWNLTMAAGSCLADGVDCYCVAPVELGAEVTVSQRAFLCTASHDIRAADRRLVTAPIRIEAGAWVFAEAFVGLGVTIGEGAVVAARGVVVKDVAPYDVVGGNPARVIGRREIRRNG
jgi:putative colanic acid biosynthesis acetyltransferase WcaF